MSRIVFLAILMILLCGQADGPTLFDNYLDAFVFRDAKSGETVVGFKFHVKDVGAVEENRKLAETLLPAAKILAETKNARLISIRGIEPNPIVAPNGERLEKIYAYVWKKDPVTRAWVEGLP
jgi:hypothetical protein